MPTIVKERFRAQRAESSRPNGLGGIALVLGIMIAATLLACLASPSTNMETELQSDMSFFAP